MACRVRASRDWALRATHELESTPNEKACFITLTYDGEHLPADRSVRPKVWQDFAKRLRKRMGPFRYLMCGEYGSPQYSQRPHYHALIYGLDFTEDRKFSSLSQGKIRQYESTELYKAWQYQGLATIGTVSWDSARYVAGYVVKKQFSHDDTKPPAEYLRRDGERVWEVHPTFGNSSRRPGLGRDWIERYYKSVYPCDEIVTPKGHKVRPPRYYDKWLESNVPSLWDEVATKRMATVKAAEREGLTTYQQNYNREVNLEKRTSLYSSAGSL